LEQDHRLGERLVKDFFAGRRILVTGGTGSIGSEIVRQALAFGPAVVRVFSRDETRQAELEQSLGERDDVRYLIGDVRDAVRLKRALSGIDTVFHAAALKHVPACEYNPFEAVQTNVVGTQNLIQAALDAGVRQVIAISTDKAVDPSNTMGATKLLAEKLITTANYWTAETRFACVRFGNVLGSRGSLVPLIARQIEAGGPVTLTSIAMTRFVMSIRQAVHLTFKAGTLATGGEIFILRMPTVVVEDLVHVLIERHARRTRIDPARIPVVCTGPRPGEKLSEALMTEEEARRTEARPDMFVVYPPRSPKAADLLRARQEAARAQAADEISPADYRSDEAARSLSRAEIRALLDEAGL
jgi:UDP-N-acetylglucosamine 4,6-dehydratase